MCRPWRTWLPHVSQEVQLRQLTDSLHRLKLFQGVENVTPYQGARDLESLFQFVMETVAGAAQEQQADKSAAEGKAEDEPKAAAEVERDEHGLLHLTDANFNDVINSKEGVLFVKFYAPW